MNKSVIRELYDNVFQSGDRLNLFIGINVLIFLLINLVTVFEFLFTHTTLITDWLTTQLSLPAHLPALPYKFWTIFTYMFTHRALFHLLFNMLWLYWMGRIFLDFLNKRQFTFTYLAGGLAGAFLFILAYHTLPALTTSTISASMLGASASVMAIVVAVATLVPNYSIRLLFFGDVRLKYLALAYFAMDVIGIASENPSGNIAHVGGAILGFIYIKQLQNGNDWSKIFKQRSQLKVVQKQNQPVSGSSMIDQAIIDSILDKISKSGYDSLSSSEKKQLFKASNNK